MPRRRSAPSVGVPAAAELAPDVMVRIRAQGCEVMCHIELLEQVLQGFVGRQNSDEVTLSQAQLRPVDLEVCLAQPVYIVVTTGDHDSGHFEYEHPDPLGPTGFFVAHYPGSLGATSTRTRRPLAVRRLRKHSTIVVVSCAGLLAAIITGAIVGISTGNLSAGIETSGGLFGMVAVLVSL